MSKTWRAAHGAAAKAGHLIVSETPVGDELAAASPADSARRERDPDGRFAKGNRVARAKRVRSGPRGALALLEAKGCDSWIASNRWGRRYSSFRRSELATAHGGEISAGVATLVESAGDLLADARYWRARAISEGNPDLSKLAASLTAQARGCERDAWELAAREARARREQQSAPTPWFVATTDPEDSE